MENFLLITMFLFIVSANIIGCITFWKKKSLYSAAFTILLLAALFSSIGGLLAIIILKDGFAIFYGLQIGGFLMINSMIVFVIAILVSVVRKISSINM
ncbi:3-isopropylmalate dehydrogenase [Solibacillus sp. R5-41]|uniref:3-isopropylmalate dehydrogenase n=1 Tax=Solibacillus sp. R5-41 TaxID=2048654 RepID=UPI000C126336|nr:3-isopropylmalate dehydrogenase [Solibacillus sp. R5-41]ATP40996.1 3-isopropylmalate dehydrogenase [Solibacillus sp. R5-41]